MAKKKIRQKKNISSHSKKSHGLGLGVPAKEVKAFMALYSAKQLSEAQQAAQRMTESYPDSAFAWKALGTTLLEAGDVTAALAPLLRSYEFNAQDALTLTSLAAVYYRQGEAQQAIKHQMEAVALQPQYAPSQYRLAEMLQSSGQHVAALEYAKKSLELGYDELKSRLLLGSLQYQTKYFSEALENYLILEKRFPDNHSVHNNLGNLYKDMGEYKRAEEYYQKALANEPGFVMAYSNIFFSKHYDPSVTQEEIINFAKGWDEKFSLSKLSPPVNVKRLDKPLRVGLISSGLRMHPVGQMITTALECSRPDIDFYAYSTNDINDHFTKKISNVCKKWQQIRHLSQNAIAEQIRNDGIDILIDLSGHGDGSCLQAISMRPAPLCVKWVGGLVNTMGLESIDYLLSDSIETPEGVDDQYTEKLIRLPDDYICYSPCEYAPNTTSLPALKNRYITLGCLNNAAKISAQLLGEWAVLMHQLPNSRLLLRGALYESQNYCQRIWGEMAQHGIEQDRILLEGPINHKEFIATYQRIDIALDTWPYSGGLTTCEALLMGVPVVTLPGPTFAGRHSATHLINAGLQELVTNSWDEYRQRVIELANDLPNLAVIRAGLRTILHYSPVCDAPRFANHFNNALRAIWVRYCEGKAPEALTFNKEGEMWFADEDMLVELPECSVEEISGVEAFEWKIDKPITIIDNAAVLPRNPAYAKWMSSGDLAVISFDPASLLTKKVEELKEYGELHYYPHALLGDGQPTTLYATLDAEKGSTLEPLPENQQPEYLREKLKVLSELPITTVALDSIEGLPSVDMLVLDDLHDAMKVLENGERSLKNTLLLQVKVAFQPTHERQPNLAELQHWSARNGLRLYRLNTPKHISHLPDSIPAEKRQATELVSVDAIFVPDHERTASLTKKQRIKLAFLLHTVYGIKDMTYGLLVGVDKENAEGYLQDEGFIASLKKVIKQPPRAFSNVQEIMQYLEQARLTSIFPSHNLPGELIVSLTSYQSRFENLHLTLRSLLLQSACPDILILWIAKEERDNLPESVWSLEKFGLKVCFCDDLRSYKKIIPTLQEYPDSFIVTADDDLYYEPDWLKELIDSWDGDHKMIVAHRAHKIRIDKKRNPLPYRQWKWQVGLDEPIDGLIFPTSGAGVLWPPHVFYKDVANRKRFMKLCPNADDVWLYWMASVNGAKIKRSNYNFNLIEWPGQGDAPLWKKNIYSGGNDQQVKNVLDFYKGAWLKSLESNEVVFSFFYRGVGVNFLLPNENDYIQRVIRSSRSFYELKMLEDICKRAPKDCVVFDVGANIGNHSIFIGLFCNVSRVCSFEPHPKTYKVLSANIDKNRLGEKVFCYNVGVGKERGRAVISYYDESNIGMAKINESKEGEVEVICIDDFVAENDLSVGLVKIDVEGMEMDVLRGASKMIESCGPVIYAEAADCSDFEAISNYLGEYGYESTERFNATATYLFVRNASL